MDQRVTGANEIRDSTIWRELLGDAILAPSPHNVQPWRVRLVDDLHADLFIEKARTLPDEDITGSFIVLSMGIFVEGLNLAAAYKRLVLVDEPVQPLESFSASALRGLLDPMIPFARLSLRPSSDVVPEFSLDCLRARHTSRLPYGREALSPDAATRLAALAAASRHRYAQTTDEKQIESILALNVEAVFEDLNHRAYREELRGWLRYSERESKQQRDGLDSRCMNVRPIELWSAFNMPGILRWPLLGRLLRRRYRAQIGPVATMGFLCGGFWDPVDAYRSGRFLLRFWLECTRLGYCIHPYGNLVTNRPIAARVEAQAGLSDIWLAFKIGRSALPPASRRRKLEEVLLA